MLRHKEKIVLNKTVCTVVKKYKEHEMIRRMLQGSGKLPKLTNRSFALSTGNTVMMIVKLK